MDTEYVMDAVLDHVASIPKKAAKLYFELYILFSGNWNHIEDLDDFFTRVYNYHQRGGYVCMALEDVFQLV